MAVHRDAAYLEEAARLRVPRFWRLNGINTFWAASQGLWNAVYVLLAVSAAVVAPSFAGLFYRNAFNLGLPLLVCPEAGRILPGDFLEVEFEAGRIHNLTQKRAIACEPPAATGQSST